METEPVLKVGVSAINLWTGWQFFYAKMGKDARITLPKLNANCCGAENKT